MEVPPPDYLLRHLEASLGIISRSLTDGKPVILLQLFGWSVGDAHGERCAAALAVSTGSFLLTVAIYVLAASCCCGARQQARYAYAR